MNTEIALLFVGDGEPPVWTGGPVFRSDGRPASVAECLARELPGSTAGAWLFWGGESGVPDLGRVREALTRPGDLWHAGLRLGMAGLPGAIDHVSPTWMLNRDPDPSIEATSWRVSLAACLVRSEVLHRMGGPRAEFRSLEGAALEFGHRCVMGGVLTRHLGWLAGDGASTRAPEIPLEDEIRFLYYRFGAMWSRWSVVRSALSGERSLARGLATLDRMTREPRPASPAAFRPEPPVRASGSAKRSEAVTVLIPTVDRYPYLETLLDQLRRQTVMPHEIVIVDQTPRDRRRPDLAATFSDLPIRLLHLDRPGQCSSRNLGLEASRGDFVLFLDDDDEIPPDLIEKHLAALERFGNDVSCGVAEEDGAGPLPEAFRLTRTSDVFPTNNALIRKTALADSGLFDLAYDRGARADADLGMRLYLAGHLMVLSSEIRVLHRHAPSGGLRTHGARVITYASSRTRLSRRHLPAPTEIYRARRYFSPRQVREMLWLATFGTFSVRGSLPRRAAKAILAFLLLPDTLRTTRRRQKVAAAMLREYPKIPPYAAGERGATAAR